MLHRYETTKEKDGSFIIHDVPIFAEISRDIEMGDSVQTMKYDEDWINTAVEEAKRREAQQHHKPVLYIEHNRDGKPIREIAGFLVNQRAHTIQYDGKPTRTVYADLVITLPEVFEEIKKGQFPGISVEIKDSQENNPQTFTAAALLNSEPPALKFDPLLVKEPKNATERPKSFMEARKTGSTFEVVCFSEFPRVVRKFADEEPIGKKFSHKEMIARGADGNLSHAILMRIPINKLDGLEPVPSNNESEDGKYHKGRKVTQPIEVIYDSLNDVYIVYSGNHRIAQAKANGDKFILAYVQPDGNNYVEQKFSDKKKDTAFDFAEEKLLDSEIGMDREDMPQFKGRDFNKLLKDLEEEGIKTTQGEISATLLKPTQEDLDPEKVESIKKEGKALKPILVSSDLFILDGHHRWASKGDGVIEIIKIDLPIEELLKRTEEFGEVEEFAIKKNIKTLSKSQLIDIYQKVKELSNEFDLKLEKYKKLKEWESKILYPAISPSLKNKTTYGEQERLRKVFFEKLDEVNSNNIKDQINSIRDEFGLTPIWKNLFDIDNNIVVPREDSNKGKLLKEWMKGVPFIDTESTQTKQDKQELLQEQLDNLEKEAYVALDKNDDEETFYAKLKEANELLKEAGYGSIDYEESKEKSWREFAFGEATTIQEKHAQRNKGKIEDPQKAKLIDLLEWANSYFNKLADYLLEARHERREERDRRLNALITAFDLGNNYRQKLELKPIDFARAFRNTKKGIEYMGSPSNLLLEGVKELNIASLLTEGELEVIEDSKEKKQREKQIEEESGSVSGSKDFPVIREDGNVEIPEGLPKLIIYQGKKYLYDGEEGLWFAKDNTFLTPSFLAEKLFLKEAKAVGQNSIIPKKSVAFSEDDTDSLLEEIDSFLTQQDFAEGYQDSLPHAQTSRDLIREMINEYNSGNKNVIYRLADEIEAYKDLREDVYQSIESRTKSGGEGLGILEKELNLPKVNDDLKKVVEQAKNVFKAQEEANKAIENAIKELEEGLVYNQVEDDASRVIITYTNKTLNDDTSNDFVLSPTFVANKLIADAKNKYKNIVANMEEYGLSDKDIPALDALERIFTIGIPPMAEDPYSVTNGERYVKRVLPQLIGDYPDILPQSLIDFYKNDYQFEGVYSKKELVDNEKERLQELENEKEKLISSLKEIQSLINENEFKDALDSVKNLPNSANYIPLFDTSNKPIISSQLTHPIGIALGKIVFGNRSIPKQISFSESPSQSQVFAEKKIETKEALLQQIADLDAKAEKAEAEGDKKEMNRLYKEAVFLEQKLRELKSSDEFPRVVRKFAEEKKDLSEINRLINELANNPSLIKRMKALYKLEDLGAKEAIPEVLKLFNDPNSEVRSNALRFFWRVKDKSVIPSVLNLLKDDSKGVRYEALQTLQILDAKSKLPEIRDMIDDEENTVRNMALRIIRDWNDKEALPKIVSYIGSNPPIYKKPHWKLSPYKKMMVNTEDDDIGRTYRYLIPSEKDQIKFAEDSLPHAQTSRDLIREMINEYNSGNKNVIYRLNDEIKTYNNLRRDVYEAITGGDLGSEAIDEDFDNIEEVLEKEFKLPSPIKAFSSLNEQVDEINSLQENILSLIEEEKQRLSNYIPFVTMKTPQGEVEVTEDVLNYPEGQEFKAIEPILIDADEEYKDFFSEENKQILIEKIQKNIDDLNNPDYDSYRSEYEYNYSYLVDEKEDDLRDEALKQIDQDELREQATEELKDDIESDAEIQLEEEIEKGEVEEDDRDSRLQEIINEITPEKIQDRFHELLDEKQGEIYQELYDEELKSLINDLMEQDASNLIDYLEYPLRDLVKALEEDELDIENIQKLAKEVIKNKDNYAGYFGYVIEEVEDLINLPPNRSMIEGQLEELEEKKTEYLEEHLSRISESIEEMNPLNVGTDYSTGNNFKDRRKGVTAKPEPIELDPKVLSEIQTLETKINDINQKHFKFEFSESRLDEIERELMEFGEEKLPLQKRTLDDMAQEIADNWISIKRNIASSKKFNWLVNKINEQMSNIDPKTKKHAGGEVNISPDTIASWLRSIPFDQIIELGRTIGFSETEPDFDLAKIPEQRGFKQLQPILDSQQPSKELRFKRSITTPIQEKINSLKQEQSKAYAEENFGKWLELKKKIKEEESRLSRILKVENPMRTTNEWLKRQYTPEELAIFKKAEEMEGFAEEDQISDSSYWDTVLRDATTQDDQIIAIDEEHLQSLTTPYDFGVKANKDGYAWKEISPEFEDFLDKMPREKQKAIRQYNTAWLREDYRYGKEGFENEGKEGVSSKHEDYFAESEKPQPKRLLQTIVVPKTIALNEEEAEELARKHGRVDDLIETSSSWRFRQRNASEFDPDSFKTKKNEGVALVYADLLETKEEEEFKEKEDEELLEQLRKLDKSKYNDKESTVGYGDQTEEAKIPIDLPPQLPDDEENLKYLRAKIARGKTSESKKNVSDIKAKNNELKEKLKNAKRKSSDDIPISYSLEARQFDAPEGLPKYVEARGEIYEYDGHKWVAPSQNFMKPQGLASSLVSNEAQPIGDEMIDISKDRLKFAEDKNKSKEKELLEKIVAEKDSSKLNELFKQLEEVQLRDVAFSEKTRSESYESAQNFLDAQNELEEEIGDLELNLYLLQKSSELGKTMEDRLEVADQITDLEDKIATKKEELKSLKRGERKFAEDLVITQIEEPVAQKNLSRAKKAELKLKKKELNKNNDEDKKYRNIVSIGDVESEKFAEQLNYKEALPDEVITNENGNIVMYKFNTEENGYQIKAIISPEGESLPIEEDEEAIFSIDMLIDPQPVPGTKYIEGSEDFGEDKETLKQQLKYEQNNPYLKKKLQLLESREGGERVKSDMGTWHDAKMFKSIESANNFLEKNPEWGLLKEDKKNGLFYVSRLDDVGSYQQDFGLLSLIESISPAPFFYNKMHKPFASALGADPDSEYENYLDSVGHQDGRRLKFAEESEERLKKRLERDPNDEDARRDLLKLRNRKSGDIERLKELQKEHNKYIDKFRYFKTLSEEDRDKLPYSQGGLAAKLYNIEQEANKIRQHLDLTLIDYEDPYLEYVNLIEGLENFAERDDLMDDESWRMTLEDYERNFKDLMSRPGKGNEVRNLKERLRDYLIEKEIPIYEILEEYPKIREAFLRPTPEYPKLEMEPKYLEINDFSEVASHLKEVALDEIQDSKEEEEKNRTLFKYYLNEFIDEKESEGLKPIQVDVALTKALGSSLYDSRENEINEVYSKRFPMGLKE